jgi:hypothetical protein
VWFPLRSNLDYFKVGTASVDFESRLKLLSILRDKIIMQGGELHLFHSERNLVQALYPVGRLTPELRESIVSKFAVGSTFVPRIAGDLTGVELAMVTPTWEVAPSTMPDGTPRREFRMLLQSGTIQGNYLVDYSTLLSRLGLTAADWFSVEEVPESVKDRIKNATSRSLVGVGQRTPSVVENSALNQSILRDLGNDLAVGSELGLPMAVDTLHGQCMAEIAARTPDREAQPQEDGRALELLVPNFSRWSWESIAKWRGREELAEFRAKLEDLESRVRAGGNNNIDVKLLQEANREIVSTLGTSLKRWPEFAGGALLTGLGFVSGPVSAAALVAGVVTQIAQGVNILDGTTRPWTALLFEMQTSADADAQMASRDPL